MPARKSRRSRSVITDRQRYGLTRPKRVRPTLPVIAVVCDDARTAVSYFSALQREVKFAVTLQVVRNPSDRATPADVVNAARNRLTLLKNAASRDPGDENLVWALIDLEAGATRRSEGLAAKTEGEKQGVSVALSDPCYEVWTLMHLQDTGELFADCSAVLARIRQKWKARFGQDFGKKAQADYPKILADRKTAAERARRHRENEDQSWTEVYLLIEEIESRCAAAASSVSTH
jgi:hypothetical protein